MNKNALIGVAVIAVLGIGAVGAIALNGSNDKTNTTTDTSSATASVTPTTVVTDAAAPTTTDTSSASAKTYKDGSYEATGQYQSPGGAEEAKVTVVLKDDTVTDVTFTGSGNHPTSRQYQGLFASGFKNLVVGKDLDSVQLSRVSGSSLTPQGFNAAIEKIKAQAKA